MKNISKTLFGQMFYFNKTSHFQFKNSHIYCETFYIPKQYIYGIFDFKLISSNEFFSNIVIGNRDQSFHLQEKYRFINNIENLTLEHVKKNHEQKFEFTQIQFENIERNLLKDLLDKNDQHIISCSCCHRF